MMALRKVVINWLVADAFLWLGPQWFNLRLSLAQTISIYHECEGGIEKSAPRITDWHHEACRVMTVGDREGRIFLSSPHTNYGFFLLAHTLIDHLYWKKKLEKDFQKILNTLKCDMVTSF